MKTTTSLILATAVALAAGCKKEDPRDRPGFVDTSDPGKVSGTMIPPPKSANVGPGGVGPGPGQAKGRP